MPMKKSGVKFLQRKEANTFTALPVRSRNVRVNLPSLKVWTAESQSVNRGMLMFHWRLRIFFITQDGLIKWNMLRRVNKSARLELQDKSFPGIFQCSWLHGKLRPLLQQEIRLC